MKIPLFSTPDKPLFSTTQKHIPIADITEDLVLFKNGSAALVLQSTSLNFGLLSEKEQQAVIAGYAALLNSLTFHIQILVRSQQKDITSYIKRIEETERKLKNPQLSDIMGGYKKFILESIEKKNVLSKSFYIVLPFAESELGLAKAIGSAKEDSVVPYTKSYVLRKAKIALYPKREHIIRQGRRLGIILRQLTNEELIKVVYDTYNPEPPVKEKYLE